MLEKLEVIANDWSQALAVLHVLLFAAAIADLGADGGRDEYIENFSAIKRWFSFFTETNDLSLEGIF